ncbi:phage baseplate assembly protein V [Robbsia andropogonis]|uniref:phage baseplate assembly protein V n=1 Tax=Robbsia andropogonis TaxID=28092 RepID=UPI003D1B286F
MMKDTQRRIQRALSSVRQAFRGVIGSVATDGAVQMITGEGLSGESLSDVELFQQYGTTSVPPKGTMAIVLPLGGESSHAVAIATEHGSYRIKGLKQGELALYTDEGDSVIFNRGRVINMTTKTLNISAEESVNVTAKNINLTATQGATVDTPIATVTHQLAVDEQITGNGGMSMSGGSGIALTGNMKMDGDATISGDAKIGAYSFLGHKHPETGSETGAPNA